MNISTLYLIVSVPFVIFVTIASVMMLINFSNLSVRFFWARLIIVAAMIFAFLGLILVKLQGVTLPLSSVLMLGVGILAGVQAFRRMKNGQVS